MIPVAALPVVERHPDLLQRRLAKVARGVCDEVMDCPFTIFVVNWWHVSITLPKRMLLTQYNALTDLFYPQTSESDGINMTKLYK